MPEKDDLWYRVLTARYLWFRKKHFAPVIFVAALLVVCAVFSPCEAAYSEESAGVALPSRFAENTPEERGPEAGTAVLSPIRATITPPPQHMGDSGKRYFVFGATLPQILCRVDEVTDIELEPGERVNDFSISDGAKWSISASWSESENNLVTHVLLQTFFPGIRSNLKIFTDRRVYEVELVSGTNVAHMGYIGFTYPGAPGKKVEEEIPPGKYRDLLVTYGIIDGADPEEAEESRESRESRLVDGAELNFRYAIESSGKTMPSWAPKSVYDADGKTYIVMSRRTSAQPRLYIVDGDQKYFTILTALKDGLYVADRLFDEAIMRARGKEEVTIRRVGL